MSVPFGQSMRSLAVDGARGTIIATWIAIALLAAWTSWFFLAEVTVRQVASAQIDAQRGAIRVVAELAPEDSLGRIWPGQHGQLRLTAFPWVQYGTVPVEVSAIDAAPKEGRVRVELAVLPGYDERIRLAHQLPGTVEIEVESLSPAALVLRAAGRYLGSPSPRDRQAVPR
jgi:hypothetical protein